MANNIFGLTDTGKVRGNNEDTFIAQSSHNGEYILAAAIDGVGGYSGGEIAAALARDTIIEHLGSFGADISKMMLEALLNANAKIYREKTEVKEHGSMACVLTLAVVDLKNNEFHYIHVGDTRLYLLRDGSLVKLTKDQSFVGFLEDSGRLTEAAAMSHPKRNEINKALGFTTGLETDRDYFETGRSPFLPGDMILLCSDGLTDMVTKEDIADVLASGEPLTYIAQKLVDKANSKGGSDNITVVLVKNDRPYQQQQAVKPVTVSKKKALTSEEPVSRPPVQADSEVSDPAPPVIRKNRPLIALLSIICAVLSIALIYLLFFRPQPSALHEKKILLPDSILSSSEELLHRALESEKGDTVVLNDSVFRQPIVVTRTINLTRGTLYIMSRGRIILKSDSLFKGPAFRVSSGAKNIVLSGLVIDGFEVGVESQTKNLKLEGIQFLDCLVPVRYQFSNTPDSFMNGSLRDIFLRTDSMPKSLQQ